MFHETKKIHSRSVGAFTTFAHSVSMNLKSSLLLCLCAAVLASAPGCNLFRKSKKPKANPNIAVEVETGFRERWVERRVAELTAQGVDPATAREQADVDFREKFPHLKTVSGAK
jgi:hypothetical protein